MSEITLQFALFAFVSVFTMVNPIGAIPMFASLTAELSVRQARAVALRACVTAAVVLFGFGLTGRWLFEFFQISVDSLRIVGGVILFSIGYEMLRGELSKTSQDSDLVAEKLKDMAITPLGIPVLAGPGAITTVILLMNDSRSLPRQATALVALLLVLAIAYLCLVGARRMMTVIGPAGGKVLMRIMGLIVMMVGVEFFFAGLRPIVQQMLMPVR